MKQNITKRLSLLLGILALITLGSACKSDSGDEYGQIRIGKDTHLSEVELSKDSFRQIILSGGNGKYRVQVENAQIATASIASDTLQIKALLEGETYATITSHDHAARLAIKINPHELYLSQDEIRLYPQRESKQIRLSGGSDIVRLESEDPEQALNYKWHARSGILELKMSHEADAKLIAVSQDGKRRTLHIKARLDGETKEVGFYDTAISSRSYIKPSPLMVIHRRGVGVWLTTGMVPNDQNTTTTTKLSPIHNPEVGQELDLDVSIRQGTVPSVSIPSGKYRVRVEEVRERHVVVRGRGFKYVIPYDKD